MESNFYGRNIKRNTPHPHNNVTLSLENARRSPDECLFVDVYQAIENHNPHLQRRRERWRGESTFSAAEDLMDGLFTTEEPEHLGFHGIDDRGLIIIRIGGGRSIVAVELVGDLLHQQRLGLAGLIRHRSPLLLGRRGRREWNRTALSARLWGLRRREKTRGGERTHELRWKLDRTMVGNPNMRFGRIEPVALGWEKIVETGNRWREIGG